MSDEQKYLRDLSYLATLFDQSVLRWLTIAAGILGYAYAAWRLVV